MHYPKWLRLIVLILALFLLSGCNIWQLLLAPDDDAPGVSTPVESPSMSDITLTGIVLINDLACERDGECALQLDVDGAEWRIVYHYGEYPPCLNTDAVQAGFTLQAGDLVEIFGKVILKGVVSTCDTADYYIQRLTE